MKVAVIGSRTLTVTDSQLAELLPEGTTEIISGGAGALIRRRSFMPTRTVSQNT